jgi:hypothetical protein
MPKDDWRRATDKDKAKKARFEYATGQPSSFEQFTDELRPLDQISWRQPEVPTRHLERSDPKPDATKSAAKPNSISKTAANRKASVTRYAVSEGVTVVVEHNGISPLSTVLALERALALAKKQRASTLAKKPAKAPVKSVSTKSLSKTSSPSPPRKKVEPSSVTEPGSSKVDLSALRSELGRIGRTLAAKYALPKIWKTKAIHTWLTNIKEATSPSKLASLMLGLEASISARGALSPSWWARRKQWGHECSAAKNMEDVQRLLIQFREALV